VKSLKFDIDMNSLLWFNFNWFICFVLVIAVMFSCPLFYIYYVFLFGAGSGTGNHKDVMLTCKVI